MIATLDETGLMTLVAENGMEAFALEKWLAEYRLAIDCEGYKTKEHCFQTAAQCEAPIEPKPLGSGL